jgi:hypothetical protein
MAEHQRPSENTTDIVLVYVPTMALISLAVVVLVYRLWSDRLQRRRLKLSLHNPCQSPLIRPNVIKAKLNRHLIYAPLSGKRHNREFRLFRKRIHMGSIPSRIQTIFIFSYFALNVAFCVVTIDWSKGVSASMSELRDTAGTAGRNNPLIPLLHISFDTFNLVHHWLGRIIVVEAIVHTLAVLVGVGQHSEYSYWLSSTIYSSLT